VNNELVTTCPYCGRQNELHFNVAGASPSPGDISLCWKCGEAAKFGLDLSLSKLTVEQKADLKTEEEYRQAVAARLESRTPREALGLWRHMQGE